MSKKPDWLNDSDFDIEAIVTFKSEPIKFIKFLDEGKKGTTKIDTGNKDKDGNSIIKEVPCVNFTVEEAGEPKTYNPISKSHIKELGEHYPLTNKTFRIEFIKGRTNFDNIYRIQEISQA